MRKPALLALEDGSVFHGQSIGVDGQTVGEVVFNTAMTGYQEILTDPSYSRQIVTLTYPHIGNVGTNPDDAESAAVQAAGLVVRDCPALASSWRSHQPLDEYLVARGVVAIADVDTRRLTRNLREKGALAGCIAAGSAAQPEPAVAAARQFPGLKGMDLAKVVSTPHRYEWSEGVWCLEGCAQEQSPGSARFHVVAYDYGIKRNILRMLVAKGCRVTVVPAQTPAEQVLALQPDGVFLSNGPGDPEPCDYAVSAIQVILAAMVPTFGICLGYQLLGLASGAGTVKMKFGHHGANHPVLEIATGRVLISSQNHGFAVEEPTLPQNLRATHRSLFDGSLQGIERTDCPAFGFQGHPEASPGPHDLAPLFHRFAQLMAGRQDRAGIATEAKTAARF